MARIRRWKEKVLVAWFTVFTSFVWAGPRSRTPEGHSSPARTLRRTAPSSSLNSGAGLASAARRIAEHISKLGNASRTGK